jgi:hypothetical protein
MVLTLMFWIQNNATNALNQEPEKKESWQKNE